MKIAISLPDPLFEAAERLAERLGVSRSELFQQAMERMVEAHRDDQITAALDRVHADEASALDEALERMQFASLPREDW